MQLACAWAKDFEDEKACLKFLSDLGTDVGKGQVKDEDIRAVKRQRTSRASTAVQKKPAAAQAPQEPEVPRTASVPSSTSLAATTTSNPLFLESYDESLGCLL